jgi:deoxyribonuclease I
MTAKSGFWRGNLLSSRASTALRFFVSAILLSSVLFSNAAEAKRYFYHANTSDRPVPYYGKEFYQHVKAGLRDQALLDELHLILSSGHVPNENDFDDIVHGCSLKGCYYHRALTYDGARSVLLGRIHLEQAGKGYSVKDVYCEHNYVAQDFPRNQGPGPDRIPAANVLNTEHTWPQSRFSGRFPQIMQKTDLHHLFPSDSQMNGIRGNFEFGEVDQNEKSLPCDNNKFGHINNAPGLYFEPPPAHRGNIARALFYFATRYRLTISKYEEFFLRKWHVQDPVDEFEMARNEVIQRIQGDRNPFIDHPELVNFVSDF